MKLKEGFITYDSGEQQILIPTGGQAFAGIVRSNETAAFIIDCTKQETTREELIRKLMDRYQIDEVTASRGVDKVLGQLRQIGALDE